MKSLLTLLAVLSLLTWEPLVAWQVAESEEVDSGGAADAREKAASFYQADKIQSIYLQISVANLAKMKAALPERIYVSATFRWQDQTIDNVGVRYKGNSSSNPNQRHKRSFLVKFSEFQEGCRFLGLERVALDNGIQFGSLFSEPLITAILRDLEIKASRCNYARLYLNGKYHGLYTNVERIDTTFTRTHFSGSGALYKNHLGGPGCNLEPLPQDFNPAVGDGLAFKPKSSAAHKDARDVLELIDRINKTPDEEFAAVMEATIDMDGFLKTMAVMLYSGAFDQLTGWNPHNYYLYHDPQSERWHYLPWDLDVAFADNAFGRIPVIAGWHAAWPLASRPTSPLVRRIIENPQLRSRYRREANLILEKYFHPRVLLSKLDANYARIKKDLAADPFPHRRVTNREDESYETIVASIRDFVRRRYETARAQLDNPGERPPLPRNQSRPRSEPAPGKSSQDAPTELTLLVNRAAKVILTWEDNATEEAGHILQRAEGEKNGKFKNHIGRPGQDISTVADVHVVPGKIYRYRVYAVHHRPTGPEGTGVSNIVTVHVPENEPSAEE
ncbi:MAG: CotH kinase family protein [Pirellulaceae bacterium]|nr:CotH kinase family protein [Pirellulaceae bacterium]